MSFIVTPGQINRRAELYHQLGSMVSAGVPLIKTLEMASANPAIHASRTTFLQLIQHLQSGLTFTESMNKVQGWMPEFDIALLSVGEESGRLDGSFKLLSKYYAFRASVIRDTLVGLLTTVATLHVFLVVFPLGYLISFAQGILGGDWSMCVPFLIQKAIVFGSLYAAVLFLIFAGGGKRGEPWRAVVETIFQMVPFLRTAQKYLALSRLTAALEATTTAGVGIVRGWEMAAAASGSPRVRREISRWKAPLESGATPAELVNQSSYFPQMFANLYNTGEQSGQMDDTLHRLHAYYQDEGFRTLRLFTRIMNGTLYGLMVFLVAFNVIRFYVKHLGAAFQMINGP